MIDAKSFSFLGTASQYIDMFNVLPFDRASTFSFCFWIKWSNASDMTFISKVGDAPAFAGYEIAADSSKRIVVFLSNNRDSGNSICVRTNSSFGDDSWHFVVVTYDGSSTAAGVLIYVDANLCAKTVVTDALSLSIVTANTLRVGCRASGGGSNFFTGLMDEIGAYNSVLTIQDIDSLFSAGYSRFVPAACELTTYGPIVNLVGWWRSDGVALPNVKDKKVGYYPSMPDSSGFGNHGTAANGVVGDIQSDATFGRVLGFSGTAFVTVADVLDFDRTDSFSISVWFKSNSANTMVLVGKQLAGGTYVGYSLQLDNGAIGVELISSYPGNWLQVKTTQTNFNNDTWHHCVMTYGGAGSGSLHIYVDNAEKTFSVLQNSLSGSISSTYKLQIGSRDGGTFPRIYTGLMCEASIWAKALSAAEVTSIWNSGVPNNLLGLSFNAYLRGWWHLGDNTYASQYDGETHNMNKSALKDDFPTAAIGATSQYLMRGESSATSELIYWVSKGFADYTGLYATEPIVALSGRLVKKLS